MTVQKQLPASNQLVKQVEAIDCYLDNLLTDVKKPNRVQALSNREQTLALGNELEERKKNQKDLIINDKHTLNESHKKTINAVIMCVHGLHLAVPKERVSSILEVSAPIFPTENARSEILGLINNFGITHEIINVARIVMPTKTKNESDDEMLDRARFIVLLKGSHLGLACEFIIKTITIKKEYIQWRTPQTKRDWLMGTAVALKIVLLNVDNLMSPLN